MRKHTLLLSLLNISLLLSSCSYSQYGAVASGSTLGGMLGSSIGGLMGGPRAPDKGTIAGMILGGAIGAAATAQQNTAKRHTPQPVQAPNNTDYTDDTYNSTGSNNDVQFSTYNNPHYKAPRAAYDDVQYLEVSNLQFIDSNNNRRLDTDEKAYIVFDIHNRSNKILYNITPNIVCSSKRVVVSVPATITTILPGQGIRYKAAVVAIRRIKNQPLHFSISFGSEKQQVVVKTFSIWVVGEMS